MAIVITTIESTEQILSGVPKTVELTTDLPSMIFYSLDGSTPTESSEVYFEAITLPTNVPSVTLKIYATDGSNTGREEIIYGPNWTAARLPRAKAQEISTWTGNNIFDSGGRVEYVYSQPSQYTVDAADIPDTIFDGYGSDPSIYPVRKADAEIPLYRIQYSDTNEAGEWGDNIGTLPKVTIIRTPPPPVSDSANSLTFNPQALVIYHDGTKPGTEDHLIFRPYYEGEDLEHSQYGSRLTNTSMEGDNGCTGGLVNYYYNPKDNTVNFYYYDNRRCRWIISKEPFRRNMNPNNIPPTSRLIGRN
jgi:hypothetical protein